MTTDEVNVKILIIGLEHDYFRFEADTWYKHDKEKDIFFRVEDSNRIEKLYEEACLS